MGATKAYFATLCVLLATINQCVAYTGNEILEDCQIALQEKTIKNPSSEAFSAAVCAATVSTLVNIDRLLINEARFCPPNDITVEQAIRVLVKYLDAHPEETHLSAETLALTAFKEAWPCH